MKATKNIFPRREVPLSYFTNSWHSNGNRDATKIPFFRVNGDTAVIRWELTWKERLKIALFGNLWHVTDMRSSGSLPPIRLTTEAPDVKRLEGRESGGPAVGCMPDRRGVLIGCFNIAGHAIMISDSVDGYFVIDHENLGYSATESGAIQKYMDAVRTDALQMRELSKEEVDIMNQHIPQGWNSELRKAEGKSDE